MLLLAALAAGCAPSPVPQALIAPARPGLSAEQLAAALWSADPQRLRLRQTARFSFRGRSVPMIGMMELDTASQQARLVAVNEMGVKLFDLSVSEDAVRENYLLPQLARYPRFGEAVGASLRRVFLAPRPRPGEDTLAAADGGYRLSGERDGQQVAFLFGGEPVRLVEKGAEGDQGEWRAVYADYQPGAGTFFPRQIVLEDRRAGYRLDLRIESVKRSDEQTD
ncbi:hypothetical protein DESUT3_02580 [Desulfuromonas versatilis]|uniref:Outer-membrane lipoprotein LolB n=2 Tax=Desulfuromonas versatilis TaxID=2802975 RepID=A0ABM8HRJ6_9BACT|nr:hypothetical protein DESUT3_02580 [Desulfuromonas versatilis]